ncbi:MAG TPA: PGPGW domain-containing protein [Candidatus Angelobacter sp.]
MVKRFALIAAGWILVVLGVAGLFLPVLPGVLLLLAGLSILSYEYDWARRWSLKLRRRFPEAKHKLQRLFGA